MIHATYITPFYAKKNILGKVIEPTISLGSHQNIGLHTGARANVVLLTYLLTCIPSFPYRSDDITILEFLDRSRPKSTA